MQQMTVGSHAETPGDVLLRRRDSAYADDLLVCAVAELDLFTVLAARPLTVDAICAAFGLQLRPVRVLVALCSALGLVEPDRQGRLGPTPIALRYLVEGGEGDLRAYYGSLRQRPAVAELLDVLRTGRPAAWSSSRAGQDWHASLEDVATAAAFTAAMDARGRVLAPALAAAIDLADREHLLDIAGGSGVYAAAALDRWPNLHATLLERPPVDAAARTLLRESGHEAVRVVAADMLHDTWPVEADVHLFSHVLHDWDEDIVRQLIRSSYASLAHGGLFVDFDAHLDDGGAGPLAVAEYSVLLAHSTQGRCYSVSEIGSWLNEAGFRDVRVIPVTAHRTALVASRP